MSELDTDALRAYGRQINDSTHVPNPGGAMVIAASDTIDALRAERDALRAERKTVKNFLRMEREAARQNLTRAESAEAERDALRRIIAEARARVIEYGGWYVDSPEDSWRFERDVRTALGMEQYDPDEEI